MVIYGLMRRVFFEGKVIYFEKKMHKSCEFDFFFII